MFLWTSFSFFFCSNDWNLFWNTTVVSWSMRNKCIYVVYIFLYHYTEQILWLCGYLALFRLFYLMLQYLVFVIVYKIKQLSASSWLSLNSLSTKFSFYWNDGNISCACHVTTCYIFPHWTVLSPQLRSSLVSYGIKIHIIPNQEHDSIPITTKIQICERTKLRMAKVSHK